jgi:GxxExxY protein
MVAILYKEKVVGKHHIDLVAENQVIVELKAASAIIPVHASQVLSYLKATSIPLGLLINFGQANLVWKRFISTGKSATSATNNP